MRNSIKFTLVCLFIPISLVFSDESSKSKPVKVKDPKFLDGINSKNPEAQFEINKLKKDFYNERERIHQSYERKIKLIKESRIEDVTELKKKYRKKLRKLRKKYPNIPDIKIDPKPKPKLIPSGIDKKNKNPKMRDRNKDKSLPKKKLKQKNKDK